MIIPKIWQEETGMPPIVKMGEMMARGRGRNFRGSVADVFAPPPRMVGKESEMDQERLNEVERAAMKAAEQEQRRQQDEEEKKKEYEQQQQQRLLHYQSRKGPANDGLATPSELAAKQHKFECEKCGKCYAKEISLAYHIRSAPSPPSP